MPLVHNSTLLDLTLVTLKNAYGEQAHVNFHGAEIDRLPAIRVKPQRRQAWRSRSGDLLLMAVNVSTITPWDQEWIIDPLDLAHDRDGHIHPGYLPESLAHLPFRVWPYEPARLFRDHERRRVRVLHKWRTSLMFPIEQATA